MARAPQALGSPLQRRSQYLAQALQAMQQEPQRISGYGDLGARLLAQALTQRALGKTERAAEAEMSNADLQRRQQIGALAGVEVPGEMQEVGTGRLGNPLAGIGRMMGIGGQPQQAPMQQPMQGVAPVEGSPLPPAMPAAQAVQDSQGQPQMPPQLQQQVQYLLGQGTPEAYQQAEQIVFGWQQQQAALASVPPEFRNDPRFMFAAQNNPEALAESLGYQYRPQVIAAGGIQSIAGENRQIGAPRFDEFGDQMVRVDPTTGQVQTVAQRGPTFAEETARMQAQQQRPVTVAPGGAVVAFDPNTGQATPQFERERAVAPGQIGSPEARIQAERNLQLANRNTDNTLRAVDQARNMVGFWTTGPMSGLSGVPGTPAANLAATIDTIEANLSFDALQAMRDSSPTGGALGQVTERELALLSATVASLRQSQSPEQLRQNLDVIDNSLRTMQQARQQWFDQQYGGQAQGSSGQPRTATNPQTGERVMWNGQAWVPVR